MPSSLAWIGIVTAIWLAGSVCASPAAHTGSFAGEEQRWRFRVLLDEREIGYHDFSVRREGASEQVEIRAQFDVRFLFINAYRYRHENTEVWRHGCLAHIDSQTDDNGERLQVLGAAADNGFSLTTSGGSSLLENDCIRTFSYWNADLLQERRLLNSQTGELVDVRVEERGADTVRFGATEIPARRYTLILEEGAIDPWYAQADGRWLALESPTQKGRTVRYEPVDLPPPASTDRLLALD